MKGRSEHTPQPLTRAVAHGTTIALRLDSKLTQPVLGGIMYIGIGTLVLVVILLIILF
jgi:hypothetical protein